ncbi:MAG: hypothetical protein ACP6IP_09690 [Candidatus Njordarchaeia archaeon]
MIPAKFVALARQFSKSCGGLLDYLRKKTGVKVDSRAFDIVVWSKVLDIPPSFTVKVSSCRRFRTARFPKLKQLFLGWRRNLLRLNVGAGRNGAR